MQAGRIYFEQLLWSRECCRIWARWRRPLRELIITTMTLKMVGDNIHLTGYRHDHYDPRDEKSSLRNSSDHLRGPESPEAFAQANLRRLSHGSCGSQLAPGTADSIHASACIRTWCFALSSFECLCPALSGRLLRESRGRGNCRLQFAFKTVCVERTQRRAARGNPLRASTGRPPLFDPSPS